MKKMITLCTTAILIMTLAACTGNTGQKGDAISPVSLQDISEPMIGNEPETNGDAPSEPMAGHEDSTGEPVAGDEPVQDPKEGESASQTDYSVTIEQMYLLDEENLLTNVIDGEELYVFLNGLSYSDETCDGLPEYSICFADGSQYYVNVTEGWVWKGNDKEAVLTDEETAFVDGFIH